MNLRAARAVVPLITLFLACVAGPAALADSMYRVVDLGALAGDGPSYVFGINNRGDVVFRTGQGSQLYSGGRLSNITAQVPHGVTAIDDTGRVYGDPDLAVSGGGVALGRWPQGGAYVRDSTGTHVIPISSGVSWLTGKTVSIAVSELHAINDQGQFVGKAILDSGGHIAFLHSQGTTTLLPSANAFGINNAGQVVGGAYGSALLFDKEKAIALGRLGGLGAGAYGINDLGQIVGASGIDDFSNVSHAFLYQDGKMQDLNSMVPNTSDLVLSLARGINNRGEIIVQGYVGGVHHAILLVPVPEPSSAALFLTAIAMCLVGACFRFSSRRSLNKSAHQHRITHHERSRPPSLHATSSPP